MKENPDRRCGRMTEQHCMKRGGGFFVSSDKPVSFVGLQSPIGAIYAAFEGKTVLYLSFTCGSERSFRNEFARLSDRPLDSANDSGEGLLLELSEYFEKKRSQFSYCADVEGYTDFQKSVLKAAARIPYGEVRSYGWLAQQAGSPKAARAAGQVMAANPVPIIIPCHRVIASSGKLCGFAGGLRALDLKKRLLDLEAESRQADFTLVSHGAGRFSR